MLLGGQGIAETKLEFEVLAHLYSTCNAHLFKTDSTDSSDCLPILPSISVFTFYFFPTF